MAFSTGVPCGGAVDPVRPDAETVAAGRSTVQADEQAAPGERGPSGVAGIGLDRLEWHVPDPKTYRRSARLLVKRGRALLGQFQTLDGELHESRKELEQAEGDLQRARRADDQDRVRDLEGRLRQLESRGRELWREFQNALEEREPDIERIVTLDPWIKKLDSGIAQDRDFRVGLRQVASWGKELSDRIAYHERVLELLEVVERAAGSEPTHLGLEDAIRRTLANNYGIEVFSYNPAIETTRVVEAEAAFDAVFFTNVNRESVDRPTGSQLLATNRQSFQLTSGLRKRLASGAQVRGWYDLTRVKQDFAFQFINPEYFSRLILELRQPLLRNFGIDVNRSLIVIAKNDRGINDLALRRLVRDTLREVEEVYWRLLQARRNIVITAREVADFEEIYRSVLGRFKAGFDILPANVATTRAALEEAKAGFVGENAAVYDAEDRLVALMNDPRINLADSIELIPGDVPRLDRIMVDRIAEVQTALDHRTEISEQDLRVANARIAVGQAGNAELPRLDMIVRVTHDGLAANADGSFDELTRRKFIEYFVGVEFEVPVGNRGPRASRRRAQLQHAQAVAQLRKVFEEVILDVNLSVRRLATSYDQIGPNFDSMEARQEEVKTQVARQERKDYPTLTTELSAWRQLAATRRAVVNAMVEYNIAIVDLERAKGTLLQFNNVIISTEVE
jgi:outer membrane protein TolC